MKLSLLSVLQTVVVVNPVGNIVALLNFCNQNAFSDGVHESAGNEKYVSFVYRNVVEE